MWVAAGCQAGRPSADQRAQAGERPQSGVRNRDAPSVHPSARVLDSTSGRGSRLGQFCGAHSLTTHPVEVRVTCAYVTCSVGGSPA